MDPNIDVGLQLELDEFGCYSGASIGMVPIPNDHVQGPIEVRFDGPRKEFKVITSIEYPA